MKINSKKSLKSKIIVSSLVLLLLLGALIFAYINNLWPFQSDNSASTPSDTSNSSTNDVDFSGPSKEDIDSSQDGKKGASTDTDNTPGSSTSRKNANVGISYSDINGANLEIRAFVNNVVEGTGTCTAILSKDGASKKYSSQAFIDASSSICKPIYIPRSDLSSGSWDIVVNYESPTAIGTSGNTKVIIP